MSKCDIRYWGLIIRVPEQKKTRRELQNDTFKCNSGAIKPNTPQRIYKSAQSCGQVPTCVNDLKHLAVPVGTPAPSPDLSCTQPLPPLTGLLTGVSAGATSPGTAHTQPWAHTEGGTASTTGSDCRPLFMSFTLHQGRLLTNVASLIPLLHENKTICTVGKTSTLEKLKWCFPNLLNSI